VSGGETYTYRMHVKAGQFLHVVINQKGAHVRLELYGPNGWIASMENLNGMTGLQQISTIAKSTGHYALKLIVEEKNASPGSCRVLMEPLHLPTKADDSRIVAERRFSHAGSTVSLGRAVREYEATMSLWRSAADLYEEAMTLNMVADIYEKLRATKKALECYNQSLPLWRTVGDQYMEGMTLNYIGGVYGAAGEKDEAIEQFEVALEFARKNGIQIAQLYALCGVGKLHFASGDTDKALSEFNQALSLAQQLGDQSEEATSLDNLGIVTDFLGDAETAIDNYERALTIERGFGDDEAEAETLNKIAGAYNELGDRQRALTYYRQALNLVLQLEDVSERATIYNNIALLYDDLKQRPEALRYYRRALMLFRRVGEPTGEARTLNNIGFLYHHLGDNRTALRYYHQALPISRKGGDRYNEAMALHNIGVASDDLGQTQEAWTNEKQARHLFHVSHDVLDEGLAMSDLMLHEKKANNPTLAIFFGKEAVNVYQQVRRNIQGLDRNVQKYFVLSKEDTYRELAELLISQGRLAEAEEVLDLLKVEEYLNYTHHRGSADSPDKSVGLTRSEQDLADFEQDVADGERWFQLNASPRTTPEERKEYDTLSDRIMAANRRTDKDLNHLYIDFGRGDQANVDLENVRRESSALQNVLAEIKRPGTIGLYTLVLETECVIIVQTAAVRVVRHVPVARSKLNIQVGDFVNALSRHDPEQDFLVKAEGLYNTLFKPIEKVLEQAHAKTLLWSLEGVLRYVPIAALYDGKQYLAERFSNVILTIPRIEDLTPPSRPFIWGLAMGVSKDYDGAGELPRVPNELESIITSPDIKNSHGPVPGTIMLDDSFTEKSMEAALNQNQTPSLVHIATHYFLNPGDDQKSYLLLGGKEVGGAGYHLSLADFADDPRINFSGVELLTLSDCQTALGSKDSDGREIDGLGITAQRKGAKAVIATLWKVDDVSTGVLMQEFYRLWTANAGMPKSEALREAQLELLHGDLRVQSLVSSHSITVDGKSSTQTLRDARATYSDPYYWAPFVLIGNWN